MKSYIRPLHLITLFHPYKGIYERDVWLSAFKYTQSNFIMEISFLRNWCLFFYETAVLALQDSDFSQKIKHLLKSTIPGRILLYIYYFQSTKWVKKGRPMRSKKISFILKRSHPPMERTTDRQACQKTLQWVKKEIWLKESSYLFRTQTGFSRKKDYNFYWSLT